MWYCGQQGHISTGCGKRKSPMHHTRDDMPLKGGGGGREMVDDTFVFDDFCMG